MRTKEQIQLEIDALNSSQQDEFYALSNELEHLERLEENPNYILDLEIELAKSNHYYQLKLDNLSGDYTLSTVLYEKYLALRDREDYIEIY